MLTVDDLAQEIRRVDGSHSLGAGALAEALMPFITAALSENQAAEVKGQCALTGEVTELVVAAREFWDIHNDLSAQSRALDKALEAFSERIPYENEPENVSAAADAYVEAHGFEHSGGIIERAFEAGAAFARSALVDVPVEPATEPHAGWALVPVKPTDEMVAAGNVWSALPGQTWTDMIDAAPLSPAPSPPESANTPVALIEREVLAELQKHKTATGTVCSPLFNSKFGDKVPLFAHPPLSHRGEDSAEVER